MMITKEIVGDLLEKYNKAIKLIYVDSKSDTETEPYASKYAASKILLDIKNNLENLLENPNSDPALNLKLSAMLSSVYLHLGIISIDTEEISAGEGHLKACHDIIKDNSNKPQFILTTLNMYNQMGLLWSQREPEKAKHYLEEAEELYLNYKKSGIAPMDIDELFDFNTKEDNAEVAWKNFEKVHTFTLYYLAQIYGALKDTLKSSVYCHITLRRQLESNDYDPIDWALNAATLSQFFMEKNGFKQARNHLAASSYILDKYEQELCAISERNEAFDAQMEVFKHRSADIARCWAKYGLLLLSKSKERLLNHTDDIETTCTITSDLSFMNLDPDSTVTKTDLENLQFTNLNLSQYENQIPDMFLLTIQDARLVFLNVQKWLAKAESYYTLENLASDHIEIVLDKSQLYLNFLFFEDSPENQAKLHKRRIDLLENIVKNVNPQFYLQYCRQIWFELAQTYSDILNIKSDKLKELNDRPSPHALTKINHLIEKSIYNFTCFIDSLKEGPKKEFPQKIGEDLEYPLLQAYFHVASLSNRFITLDKKIQLSNIEASFEYYKKVVDYCNEHEKAKELIPIELGICKEMASLLPIKIAKLRQNIS